MIILAFILVALAAAVAFFLLLPHTNDPASISVVAGAIQTFLTVLCAQLVIWRIELLAKLLKNRNSEKEDIK